MEQKLYNIKILKSFAIYLSEELRLPHEKLEELFQSCGSHISALDLDDYWFDQSLADKFYENAVSLTNDQELAYKVGEYSIRSVAKGFGGRIIFGFLTAPIAFKNIQALAKAFTKASHYEPVKISDESATIRCIPEKDSKERAYQCQNRRGTLEAIPKFFGSREVTSNHDFCIHNGHPYCEYRISWKLESSRKYKFIRGLVAVCAAVLISWNTRPDLATSMTLHVLSVFLLLEGYLFFKTIRKNLSEQNQALQDSFNAVSRRHDEQNLIRQVVQRTTEMMPISELCETTVESIQATMNYDRAGIALVNTRDSTLEVKATRGYQEEVRLKIEGTKFKIRSDNESGILIVVVNTNKPIFAPDVTKLLTQFSERTRKLVLASGTRSLIAVPITFKNRVLGVLTVENHDSAKKLAVNDKELLVNLADHIAVAISNGMNYESTLASLRRTQELEAEQRLAKEVFERYVPIAVRDQTELEVRKDLTNLENKIITVMFIDLIGFTSMSEKMGPERVAELLGVYIRYINEIVINTGGRINKIIGDGLMIYFEEGEGSAIRTGFEILFGLPVLNKKLKTQGYDPIELAVGAHKGPCTLGSIGYEKRLDYTIIGDTVNTAARIESKTRDWGPNTFLFSASLQQEAEEFVCLSRGSIKLKGKDQELELYQLLFPKIFEQKNPDNEEKAA